MSDRMKALVWYGKHDLRLEQVPKPLVEAHNVLVQVTYSGMCATDREIYEGSYSFEAPYILGHEIAGVVVETGCSVTKVLPGSRVIIDPLISCEHCPNCKAGKPEFCLNYTELGINTNGGWAEYVSVPQRNVHLLPPEISDQEAGIIEALICPFGAAESVGIKPDEHVLIWGDGPAAMFFVQIARMLGAFNITSIYKRQDRAAELIACGAARAISVEDMNLPDRLSESNSAPIDLVIDAVGSSDTVKSAVHFVRPGGRILLYGLQDELTTDFPHREVIFKNITLYGRTNSPSSWGRAIRAVAEGKLQLNLIVDHVIQPGQVEDCLKAGNGKWKKSVIQWKDLKQE